MALFLVGLLISGSVVVSAIRTVVVPRPAPVRLTSLVFRWLRVLFDLRSSRARSYEARDAAMALYAPLALIALPLVWIAGVLFGFALLYWSVGEGPWGHSFVISGSSLLTLGFERPATVAGTVLSFIEASLGFAVLALLLVTYLPSMYAAFSRREQAVVLLEVRAGSPPSGVEMLGRYARIGGLEDLTDVWRSWEELFADLQESHTSLPALVFFRSQQPHHSWVTSAGALLDAASLYVSVVDLPEALHDEHDEIRVPEAETCIRAGYLALRHIASFFDIPHDPDPAPDDPISISRDEFDAAVEELRRSGVPVVDDLDAAWRAFAGWRVNYDAVLVSLAGLVMAPYARWSSDRSIMPARRLRRSTRQARNRQAVEVGNR